MSWWSLVLLGSGGLVASLNFYLSFVAAPLHRLRHGRWPRGIPSGFPIVGTLLLLGAVLALPSGSPLRVLALVLAVADTGGPHWFVATQVRDALNRRRRK
jgi:hypothetical protein